jgi:hypothetical protein
VRGTQVSWKTCVVGGHYGNLLKEVSCDGIVTYLEIVPQRGLPNTYEDRGGFWSVVKLI